MYLYPGWELEELRSGLNEDCNINSLVEIPGEVIKMTIESMIEDGEQIP